jgi:hypothetical protein
MRPRKFKVLNKVTDQWETVEGEEALAKLIDVPVSEIPRFKIFKYTVRQFQIYETSL